MRDGFRLILVSDRAQCGSPLGDDKRSRRDRLLEAIDIACKAGIKVVQLREKDLDSRDLLSLAGDLRRLTEPHHCRLLINDRVDIALATKSDGVHCPESGISPASARAILGDQALIGASCHSLERALSAVDAGADFVIFGPVYETPSKTGYGPPLGLEALHTVCRRVTTPVFAIGGIDPERSAECLDAGASGVAVISAVLASEDIAASVGRFEKAMGGL